MQEIIQQNCLEFADTENKVSFERIHISPPQMLCAISQMETSHSIPFIQFWSEFNQSVNIH